MPKGQFVSVHKLREMIYKGCNHVFMFKNTISESSTVEFTPLLMSF